MAISFYWCLNVYSPVVDRLVFVSLTSNCFSSNRVATAEYKPAQQYVLFSVLHYACETLACVSSCKP